LESRSKPLTNEELDDLGAQVTQKQQQQEHENPGLQPIETHNQQEIPAVIDSYLQRLSDIDPDWERS
jgi:hypothetical protein